MEHREEWNNGISRAYHWLVYYRQVCNLIFPDYRRSLRDLKNTYRRRVVHLRKADIKCIVAIPENLAVLELPYKSDSNHFPCDFGLVRAKGMEILRELRMQITAWSGINTLHVNEREIYFSRYNQTNVTLLNRLARDKCISDLQLIR